MCADLGLVRVTHGVKGETEPILGNVGIPSEAGQQVVVALVVKT